ncbi:hypothetical protein PV11_07665 [Exophiala sideris]|uniref:Uncharacterized protein n=1 Tax=Exophiala sideris TaxID=1016849 RepID=A0A0D1YGP2_9EURO|nr:hypothetical protein PV11_07665 [Exophiala sideris]
MQHGQILVRDRQIPACNLQEKARPGKPKRKKRGSHRIIHPSWLSPGVCSIPIWINPSEVRKSHQPSENAIGLSEGLAKHGESRLLLANTVRSQDSNGRGEGERNCEIEG